MNPEKFMTQSLHASPQGGRVARILAASIQAVDPKNAVQRHLKRDGNLLQVGTRSYNLDKIERIFLISFGKASIPMTEAAASILRDWLTSGIVITKEGDKGLVTGNQVQGSQFAINNSQLSIISASHPVPDERGVAGARKIIELLSTATENDLTICLISGGGSALLTSPAPGISLDDIQALTKSLLGCGATINEINTLRKHLSQVKGGQLARLAAPAQVVTLILSDVINDPLDVIASGPTVPDPSTFSDALQILKKYQIASETSAVIFEHLKRGAAGEIPETPKSGDPTFKKVQNVVVGNNLQAAQAAVSQAQTEGFNTLLLTTSLQGEASVAGQIMSAIAQQVTATGDPIPRPACIIAGGETTVTLSAPHPSPLPKGEGERPPSPFGRGAGGEGGKGGRNQELALGAVAELAGLEDVMLIALATDGDDGPTDAAGAVVTGETLRRAALSGLNPSEFLARNDAYNFFDPLGDLLKPGLTHTNVCDLTFIFAL